ncbi:MAG: CHASE3 domain-containing protein [Pseudomonadota bacterium]|nr:CHASE3 domain-containing protein [Pseudomonadota bacterium]
MDTRNTEKLPVGRVRRAYARLGFLVLGLAAVFNLGALSVAETSYEQLQLSSGAVVQTQRVTNAIDRLLTHLLDAETGERGYLITGDAAYLLPYQQARQHLAGDVDTVQALIADNAVQANQLATVRRLVRERLAEMEATIEARRAQGFEDALGLVMTHAGKISMDTVRAALGGMVEEESRVRSARIGGLTQHQRAIRLGLFAEALLNFLLVTLGGIFLARDLRRHRHERESLQERGATLEAQVRERTAQLTELSRFQEHVREDEKKRVARELHDELGGTLTAAKIDLQLIADRLRSDPTVAPRMTRISAALDDAIAVKRRIIEDLRPTLLDNLGLCAALKWQCEEFAKRTGCPCHAVCSENDPQPSPDQSVALYRIVQEALTNIAKYAEATSVDVELMREEDHWRLTVRDDGVGIDPEKQHHPTSHGLISIRERARNLGGNVLVQGRAGEGTDIEVKLPILDDTNHGDTAGSGRAT